MASKIAQSAKQQQWRGERHERELPFIREAISLLTGARDILDKHGKVLVVGSASGKRSPGAALRWLRENGVTMVFPREVKQ